MTLLAGLALVISILYFKKTIWAGFFIVAIILYIYWKNKKNAKYIIIFAFLMGCGLWGTMVVIENIDQVPHWGIVIRRSDNYYILFTLFGRFYVQSSHHHYEVGDLLSFSGYIKKLYIYRIEQQFDFGGYLGNMGVQKQLFITSSNKIYQNLFRPSLMINRFLDNYQTSEKELMASLLFNQRNYSSPLFQKFATLQIFYLIGASGLHINALIRLNKKILKKFRLSPLLTKIISLFPLIILGIFTPSHFAIYRIGVINTFRIINEYKLKRQFSYVSIVSLSGLLFLFIDPYLAYQPTYYLSYGLIIFFTLSRATLANQKPVIRPIISGIFAYLLMLPYVLTQNYYLHICTFIFVILLAPLLSFTYVVGGLSIFLSPLQWLITLSNRALFFLLDIFVRLDIKIPLGRPTNCWITVFYSLLFLLIYAITVHHHPIISLCTISFTLLIGLPAVNLQSYLLSSIYFINVGQGDAILLRNQRHAVLIDTGGSLYSDIARETLIPFFASIRLPKLDAVWISHEDFDHCGALNNLLLEFPVDTVLRQVKEWEIDGWYLKNLNFQASDLSIDRNDQSAVVYVEMLGEKLLLMGDASTRMETKIILENPQLDIDILKLGHHGSETSTSQAFLQVTTPKLAIISVGRNNYGHPHQSVIEKLETANIYYLRTDQVGTIKLTGWGNVCYNVTSKKFL